MSKNYFCQVSLLFLSVNSYNSNLFSPKIGDDVTIYVRGDSEIDQIIAIVMSRYGNIESHQVYCSFHINCEFNITITRNMMPEVKVVVYDLKDRRSMYQGQTTIRTEELGKNTVSEKSFQTFFGSCHIV